MLAVGDRLPEFALRDDQGAALAHQDLCTGTVVLYFYPRDDAPGCTKQACAFRDGRDAFAAQGVRVYGVSPDDVGSHQAFRDKFGLNFPLIADPAHTLCEAFGVWGPQESHGHRFTGVARTTFVLQEGLVTHVLPDVDVTGHVERVLALVF